MIVFNKGLVVKCYKMPFTFLKKVNPIWLILILCGLNSLVMHYYIFFTCGLGGWGNFLTFANNFFSVIMDVCFILMVSYLLSAASLKISLYVTFYSTLLWSFANVLYSRFFQHYISFSAIGQGDSLFDWLMLRIIINGLSLFDCYYLIAIISFCFLIKLQIKSNSFFLKILYFFLLMLALNVGWHIIWCSLKPDRRYISYCVKLFRYNHFYQTSFSLNPNYFFLKKETYGPFLRRLILISRVH